MASRMKWDKAGIELGYRRRVFQTAHTTFMQDVISNNITNTIQFDHCVTEMHIVAVARVHRLMKHWS